MKVLIDLNILLDVSLNRIDFVNDSAEVLSLAVNKKIDGYISAISTDTFFYIVAKNINTNKAKSDLRDYLTFLNIAKVDINIIRLGLTSNFKDYEDALQYFSGSSVGCDCVVTRNPRDFKHCQQPIYTPKEFLELNKRK
jgi:predicted nucleic acid-binding protein